MQLKDLILDIESQSDEELLERLRQSRHNRTVERPAAKARAEKAETKKTRATSTKAEKLLAGLSPEELQLLMSQIEES